MLSRKRFALGTLALAVAGAGVVFAVTWGRLSIPGLRLAENTPAFAPPPTADIPFDQIDAG